VTNAYFNLTNESYLIDLIRFFDHLVVAYFFGPLCMHVKQITRSNGKGAKKQENTYSLLSDFVVLVAFS